MKKAPVGLLLLTAVSLIWGGSLVAQRLGMNHLGPFTFNAARFCFGGMALAAMLPLLSFWRVKAPRSSERAERAENRRVLFWGGLWSGLALFGAISSQQVGLIYTSIGKTGFITSLYILIVPLLGLLAGKRLPRRIWACIALALFGMYLLCINEDLVLNTGDLYMLFCAAFSAGQILLIARFCPQVNALELASLHSFVCAFFSALAAFFLDTPRLADLLQSWAPLLYTGLLSTSLAYSLQIVGQKEVNPVIASLILSLEAVFGALFGWLLLNELMTGKERLGCLLILLAILAAQLPEKLRRPIPAPAVAKRPE